MWDSILPDDLWMKILEMGISSSDASNHATGGLNYRDLCSLSMTSKRLNTLSNHHFFWSALLSADFDFKDEQFPRDPVSTATPTSSSASSYKDLYRIRYERDRERRRLAHRRVVLRFESEVAVSSRKIATLKIHSDDEKEKLRDTLAQLFNLRNARQASVALNVWQPEVIRGKQKQMVEQYDVPIDSRISSLEMEVKLCRQQIANNDTALGVEQQRLDRAKEKLESLKYNPLLDLSCKTNQKDEHIVRRKKLKCA